MKGYIYAEFRRCVQCQGCEVACQREHDGQSNMNVVLVNDRFAVPIACQHCDPAPCLLVCPNEALSSDGVEVKLDQEKCTGCRLCTIACPFGAMGFNAKTLKAAKCDLCEHRRANGKDPACVTTCPSQALNYDLFEKYGSVKRRRAITSLAGQPPLKGGFR